MGDDDAKRPRARGGKEGGTDGAGVVLFNCTKGELFTPSQGYKQFARRLRTSHRPAANKEEVRLRAGGVWGFGHTHAARVLRVGDSYARV
jgi:hypothetical protein